MSVGAEASAQAAAEAVQRAAAAAVVPVGGQPQANVNPGGDQAPEAAAEGGGEAGARGVLPQVSPDLDQIFINPVSDAVEAAAVKQLSNEFEFLLKSHHVPRQIQARLVRLGFKDVDTFANLEDSKPEVRAFIKTEVGLNPNAEKHRSHISRLLSAWESSVTRGIKRRAEDAEQLAHDLPRKLPKQTHLNMINAYNEENRELKPEEIPHSTCVELKLTQCETGKLVAEKLNEVAGEDEVKDDNLGTARIKASGDIL